MNWKPMSTAPKNKEIKVLTQAGQIRSVVFDFGASVWYCAANHNYTDSDLIGWK